MLPAAPSGMNCVGISGNQLIHLLDCEFALPLAGPVYYPLYPAPGCCTFVCAQSGQQLQRMQQ